MLESTPFLSDSPAMAEDPLSDVLRLANVQPVVAGGFTAGGRWSIRFPRPDKLKFFAIVKGGCWLCIDGEEEARRIEAGDVCLLSISESFLLAGDLEVVPLDATTLFTEENNRTNTIGTGEDCVQIGGHVRLDPITGRLLADILPPVIHIRSTVPQAAIVRWLLDQLVSERAFDRLGGSLASAQLIQLMFLQILRVYLETSDSLPPGSFRAISDKRLATVIRLMHADPARSWRLDELARVAAMSRTTFAQYFKSVAGVAPLTYLTEWRMRLAEQALRDDDTPLSMLAGRFGYASESAFSNAFKRVTGMSPHRFRGTSRAPMKEDAGRQLANAIGYRQALAEASEGPAFRQARTGSIV